MRLLYYVLNIYLEEEMDQNVKDKYYEKIHEIQNKFDNINFDSYNLEFYSNLDSGFDLFTPEDLVIKGKSISNKVDCKIKCSMYAKYLEYGYYHEKINMPCAFYLFPRSSTGSKTPLRLSNSVGIIDAGYRGKLGGIVDNISDKDFNINKNDRLFQICGSDISFPIYPKICHSLHDLGITERGEGGFGSTGR